MNNNKIGINKILHLKCKKLENKLLHRLSKTADITTCQSTFHSNVYQQHGWIISEIVHCKQYGEVCKLAYKISHTLNF